MRFALVRVSDDSWRFIWTCHHLLIDGWSRPLVLNQVTETYEAQSLSNTLSPLDSPRPFRDYIRWLAEQDVTAANRFWRETLRGFAAPTPIIAVLPKSKYPDVGADQFASRRRELSTDITQRVQAAARRCEVTLSTLLHGAWALVLARYTDSDDVVFGTTVSGRPPGLEGVEQMVGLFINTLPVRVRIPRDQAAGEWLRDLQAHMVEARQFEYSSLAEVQRLSDVPAGVPLFESLVVFENYPSSPVVTHARSDARFIEWTNYPLTFTAIPGARLVLEVSHTRRVNADAIGKLLDQLETVLSALANDVKCPVAVLPLMSRDERYRLAVEWNVTWAARPKEIVSRLVALQAARVPDAIALVSADLHLTYAELMARAETLITRLRSVGAAPGTRVGVFLPRSIYLPVVLLAILDAGGAYVILDPASPPERVKFMARDAKLNLLVTEQALAAQCPVVGIPVLLADAGIPITCAGRDAGAERSAGPEDAAYVVYTSGTTGEPKGVAVAHRALLNHALAAAAQYELRASDRVLQFSAVSFDVIAEEIFPTWLVGGTVVVWPASIAPSIAEFVRFVDTHRLTILNLPTPFWHEWVDEIDRGSSVVPLCVRHVVVGSDRVAADKLARWLALVGDRVRWSNAYGCAEATVTSTVYRLSRVQTMTDRSSRFPLGGRLRTRACMWWTGIWNWCRSECRGELVIAGDGVALGYWERPALTAEKFIAERWREGGGRAYRTGDLVRYRADGALEILGRLDDQVKIRGFRVEPGEVEAVLARHPAVREVAVVARTVGREQRLVAYVVADGEPAEAGLRAWLRERVPEYLVPAALMRLDRLPLTANGKVDRAALPMPRMSSAGGYKGGPPNGGGDTAGNHLGRGAGPRRRRYTRQFLRTRRPFANGDPRCFTYPSSHRHRVAAPRNLRCADDCDARPLSQS